MTDTLTAVDAAWLYLEAPERPMNVSQLLIVDSSARPDGRLGLDDLRALVEARLHLLPRLRQRPALPPVPGERPVWADDPAFDLGAHLQETTVSGAGDPPALGAVAAAIHVEPLGLGRPLWEVHLLQSASGGTAAILVKWHHALADAMAGLAMVRRLLETGAGTPDAPPAPWTARPVPAPFELLHDGDGTDAQHRLRQLTSDPAALGDDLRPVYRALEALLATGSPPRGPLGRPAAAARRAGFATLPFAEARQTRVALGTSMAELFLTLAAGAVSRLFAGRGIDAASVRVMVPLLARGDRGRRESGNHAAYVFF
ncbi:MAG TPA: wax ester/triacylglycerol synthase domain-containing protein, partial [Actinomycetota bacterium]